MKSTHSIHGDKPFSHELGSKWVSKQISGQCKRTSKWPSVLSDDFLSFLPIAHRHRYFCHHYFRHQNHPWMIDHSLVKFWQAILKNMRWWWCYKGVSRTTTTSTTPTAITTTTTSAMTMQTPAPQTWLTKTPTKSMRRLTDERLAKYPSKWNE